MADAIAEAHGCALPTPDATCENNNDVTIEISAVAFGFTISCLVVSSLSQLLEFHCRNYGSMRSLAEILLGSLITCELNNNLSAGTVCAVF